MARYNPFKPGSIVSPGMFSGRMDELSRMDNALLQTKLENPLNFLINGERGIGKSSLLFYLQLVARGEIERLEDGRFNFLTVSIELEPSDSYTDIIQKVSEGLREEVAETQPANEAARKIWDFVKKWEVMGVKFSDSREERQPKEFLRELTDAAVQTCSRLQNEIDGIVILIDEADKAPVSANLGEFVKVFTEHLTKRGCNKVCIGLSGLSTLLQNLRESHESSVRIFDILTLDPLLPAETNHAIEKGLEQATKKNGFEVSILPVARDALSELSEGYPHFLQQFAWCAFNADSDNVIDLDDVREGSQHPEKGAIQQLGIKYFQDLYFDQIGSDEYRGVLRAMAVNLDGWVTKAEIRQKASIKETTLNNAIAALKKKHIILTKPGVAGTYKLPTKSFAVWIRALTKTNEDEIVEQKGSAREASLAEEIPNPETTDAANDPNEDTKQ